MLLSTEIACGEAQRGRLSRGRGLGDLDGEDSSEEYRARLGASERIDWVGIAGLVGDIRDMDNPLIIGCYEALMWSSLVV